MIEGYERHRTWDRARLRGRRRGHRSVEPDRVQRRRHRRGATRPQGRDGRVHLRRHGPRVARTPARRRRRRAGELPELHRPRVRQGRVRGRLADVFDVQIDGTYRATQVFADAIDDGCVVNIAPFSSQIAIPNLVAYSTAKGGVDAFTRTAAEFLGLEIRVNAVRRDSSSPNGPPVRTRRGRPVTTPSSNGRSTVDSAAPRRSPAPSSTSPATPPAT